MSEDQAAKEAAELLPCFWRKNDPNDYCGCVFCYKRPAVAAALRKLYEEIAALRAERDELVSGQHSFQDYIKIHGTRLDGLKAALEAVGRGFWLGMYRGAPMYCDCQHNIRAEIAAEEGRGHE